jgi:hypothetical protein
VTARQAIVVQAVAAAALLPVCWPVSAILGAGAAMVAIDSANPPRRAARRRARPVRVFQAHPKVGRL